MAQKKGYQALFRDAPVTSYHYVDNRLLIVDWASLSYHMFWSLDSAKNREKYGLMDAEGELALWRTMMVNRIIHYVALFNPRKLVFALEGKQAWRKQFVEDYYKEHAVVYWEVKNEFYVVADNYVYMVQRADDGTFAVTKLSVKQLAEIKKLTHCKKLGELPPDMQKTFWSISTHSGTPILPSYKGQRKAKPWPFSVEKKVWAAYREQFAKELAPLFRAKAVQCLHAEGDDIIYASVQKYAGDSDDVIIITRDSDMTQIANPKVKILNHQTDTFINQDNPTYYLDHKVLCGDDSDNINGMAFVNEKDGKWKADKGTQISDKGAVKLLENCSNIYSTAKEYGWDDQYMRNRTLIDLSMVPADIKKEISFEMDAPDPETVGGFERLEFWEVPQRVQNDYLRMQTTGFYCVNSANSRVVFDATRFAQYRVEAAKPPVEIDENAIVTADNFGLDEELSDIDVIF